jgi:catechol 2,3-dioxygenase-like lactoylglutathione lyase family enzyme
MAKVTALHHAAITVPTERLEEARRFYSDVIGLRETERPEAELGRPGIWYGFGATELHIQCRGGAPPADSDYHPALIVDDLSGLRDRIEASGATTEDAPMLMGRRRFFARDPFGNRIEFMSLP